MKHFIKHLQEWTKEKTIAWEYLPAFGNLFGVYPDGDVSLCRLAAFDVYYKMIVNRYDTIDGGTVIFYIMSNDPYFHLIESVRKMAIRRAKRIEK